MTKTPWNKAHWALLATLLLTIPATAYANKCEKECKKDAKQCQEICKKYAGSGEQKCTQACVDEEKECTKECK
ncbi:hypothetical protein KYC5002_24475 [Archangium violaceum]|uniref:hypothetical protein n=1 Tax=Archangium violaceum TaxID=83451 RepID=UPI002B2B42FF|nr:hypothetical protein KYC5002_24475 [Archangium gephyra]